MSERYKAMTVEDEVILPFKVFDKTNKGFKHETEFKGIMTIFGDPMEDDDNDQTLLDANTNNEGNIVCREFVCYDDEEIPGNRQHCLVGCNNWANEKS